MEISREKIHNILKDYNIKFVTAGKNVSKNSIASLNCPYCGDDEGNHLGIMNTGYYTCWRNKSHSGRVEHLVSYLCGVSYAEATRLIFDETPLTDNFLDNLKQKLYTKEVEVGESLKRVSYLAIPKNFEHIPVSSKESTYLSNRGFTLEKVKQLVSHYHLMRDKTVSMFSSIVIPILENHKLMTWTKRSLDFTSAPASPVRWKSLSKEESVRPIKDCLFDYDFINKGGKILFIFEGPFDAMKVWAYSPEGIETTCLFTTSISDRQLLLLTEIAPKYEKVILVLDKGAEALALRTYMKMSFIRNIKFDYLYEADDPGDLTEEQVMPFIERVSK